MHRAVIKLLRPDASHTCNICQKYVCSQGSSPDSTGGALLQRSPDLIAGFKTHTSKYALKQISWISANLLTINSSETSFKQQLSKIDNSSLNTIHSARNLGFIFDEKLTFSDQISSLSKSCYSHISELRYIRHYLDSKTASTIAASIVHSKLDYCNYNSLYYNLPKSQINRLQQLQNCLARTVVKAIPSSDLFTGSRLMNALNINSCHSPTKFLLPANLTTYTILPLLCSVYR